MNSTRPPRELASERASIVFTFVIQDREYRTPHPGVFRRIYNTLHAKTHSRFDEPMLLEQGQASHCDDDVVVVG